MKRLTMLIVLVSLIAVVSNAEDFSLLSNEPGPPTNGGQNFSDFLTWLVAGSLCAGAGLLLAISTTTDTSGDRLPGVIIGGSIGLGTAMTISLLSSSGLTTNQIIGFRVVPVLLGAPVAIIVVPVLIVGGLLWAFVAIL